MYEESNRVGIDPKLQKQLAAFLCQSQIPLPKLLYRITLDFWPELGGCYKDGKTLRLGEEDLGDRDLKMRIENQHTKPKSHC